MSSWPASLHIFLHQWFPLSFQMQFKPLLSPFQASQSTQAFIWFAFTISPSSCSVYFAIWLGMFALLGFWNHLWLSFRRFLHRPCVYQKQYHKLTHYSSQKFTFYKSPGFPFLESINEPSGWRSVPKPSVTQMGWIS